MKTGVIGVGGVGGYFGTRLAESGVDVTLIARGKHLEAIRRNGLRLKSVNGDAWAKGLEASDQMSALKDCQLVILAVKAYQVREVAFGLSKHLAKEAIILPLQNGVLASPELQEYLEPKQVLGGLCRLFSHVASPGIIHHTGLEPSVTFGEWNGEISYRVEVVKEMFDRAGVKCTLADDVEAELWRKFMLICLSGLGTVLDSGFGLVREMPETRQMIVDVLTEVGKIARAKRVRLEEDIVERSLEIVDAYPYDAKSSLFHDIRSGRPSEIEYQNGTVVRLGKELGIDTPANRWIYGMVKLLEKKQAS